jgi:DNA-binding CsgD family transcriptional regulator
MPVSKSNHLRRHDLVAAMRIVGECRDLGSDSDAWHKHALVGLCRLLPSMTGSGGEGHWQRPRQLAPIPTQIVTCGFDPFDERIFKEYHRQKLMSSDPLFLAAGKLTAPVVTRTRRQLVEDQTWYNSLTYNEFRKQAHSDDVLQSVATFGGGHRVDVLTLQRTVGDRPFSERDRRLLHFFHCELRQLIGPVLVTVEDSYGFGLQPRLRKVLEAMLQGRSEDQIAATFSLSVHTVHGYIKTIRKHFGAKNRAEVIASCLETRHRIEKTISENAKTKA